MKATKEQVLAQQSKMQLDNGDVCACCGKQLKGNAAWLELSFKTNKYYIDNVVPQEESQGYFPFGLTCAKKVALAVY
jgi:hypothetical protein